MNYIELRPDQLIRKGNMLKPIVPGYDSVFFHPLTKNSTTDERQQWGLELTAICKNDSSITFYWFDNEHPIPEKREIINVYPNHIIERWWASR